MSEAPTIWALRQKGDELMTLTQARTCCQDALGEIIASTLTECQNEGEQLLVRLLADRLRSDIAWMDCVTTTRDGQPPAFPTKDRVSLIFRLGAAILAVCASVAAFLQHEWALGALSALSALCALLALCEKPVSTAIAAQPSAKAGVHASVLAQYLQNVNEQFLFALDDLRRMEAERPDTAAKRLRGSLPELYQLLWEMDKLGEPVYAAQALDYARALLKQSGMTPILYQKGDENDFDLLESDGERQTIRPAIRQTADGTLVARGEATVPPRKS